MFIQFVPREWCKEFREQLRERNPSLSFWSETTRGNALDSFCVGMTDDEVSAVAENLPESEKGDIRIFLQNLQRVYSKGLRPQQSRKAG